MTPAEVLAGMRPLSPGRRVKVGGRTTAAEILAHGVVGAVRGQLAHRSAPARVDAALIDAAARPGFDDVLHEYSESLKARPARLTF
ncbi:hypothetical protein ACI2LJ_36010 [Streptomyces sp. NPDC088090]|uniref:hypothetical protein n=1 Tax=Streptomyces sp. NPDC088090 TaxID=3365822 RepID=UPI00384F6FA7